MKNFTVIIIAFVIVASIGCTTETNPPPPPPTPTPTNTPSPTPTLGPEDNQICALTQYMSNGVVIFETEEQALIDTVLANCFAGIGPTQDQKDGILAISQKYGSQ